MNEELLMAIITEEIIKSTKAYAEEHKTDKPLRAHDLEVK